MLARSEDLELKQLRRDGEFPGRLDRLDAKHVHDHWPHAVELAEQLEVAMREADSLGEAAANLIGLIVRTDDLGEAESAGGNVGGGMRRQFACIDGDGKAAIL